MCGDAMVPGAALGAKLGSIAPVMRQRRGHGDEWKPRDPRGDQRPDRIGTIVPVRTRPSGQFTRAGLHSSRHRRGPSLDPSSAQVLQGTLARYLNAKMLRRNPREPAEAADDRQQPGQGMRLDDGSREIVGLMGQADPFGRIFLCCIRVGRSQGIPPEANRQRQDPRDPCAGGKLVLAGSHSERGGVPPLRSSSRVQARRVLRFVKRLCDGHPGASRFHGASGRPERWNLA